LLFYSQSAIIIIMDFEPSYLIFHAALCHLADTKWKRKLKIIALNANISSGYISDLIYKKKKASYKNQKAIVAAMGETWESFNDIGLSIMETGSPHKSITGKGGTMAENYEDLKKRIQQLEQIIFSQRLSLPDEQKDDSPKIEILSPFLDQEVGYPLKTVIGTISESISSDLVVLIGHRELAENGIAIRVDRQATIFSGNTFRADNIYLGSEELGINETFEITALIVNKIVFDGLDICGGGKAFSQLPPHISKTTTLVKRVK